MKMKKPRHFYAVEYAYGRDTINSRGIRADQIHRFPTKASRVAFVHDNNGTPYDVDSLPAKDARVQTANRYAAQGLDWPIAVL